MILVFVLFSYASCSSNTNENKNHVVINVQKPQASEISTTEVQTEKNKMTIPDLILTHQYSDDLTASYINAIKEKYAKIQALEINPVSVIVENNEDCTIENRYYYNIQNELVKITVRVEKSKNESSEIREYYFENNSLFFLFIKQSTQDIYTFESEYRYYIHENSLLNSLKKEWNSNMDVPSIDEIENQTTDSKNASKYYEEALNLQNSADANALAISINDNYFVSFPHFAFIYENKYLLIKPYDNEALIGEPYDVSPGTGTSDVDMEALPFFYKNLIGKEFDIFDEKHGRTTVRIKSFNVILAFTPHSSERQRFNDEDNEESNNPIEMFQSSNNKFLVASFEFEETSTDFIWGRLSSLPEVTAIFKSDSDIHNEYYKEILASDNYTKIQDDYNTYLQDEYKEEGEKNSFPEKWFDYARSEDAFYSTSKVTASFIYIESGEPCGEPSFGGEIKESLIKYKDDTYTLSEIISIEGQYLIPIQAIDINNDDIPEFIFKDWRTGTKIIIYYYENNYHEYGNYIPNHDCGC
ncbi:MAG: hypothetical protein IPO21_02080 [Bacteroidales bacterium]|nr:hypothetical protein [Bacteroidales bacterium]